jgi:hypothetical protein
MYQYNAFFTHNMVFCLTKVLGLVVSLWTSRGNIVIGEGGCGCNAIFGKTGIDSCWFAGLCMCVTSVTTSSLQ